MVSRRRVATNSGKGNALLAPSKTPTVYTAVPGGEHGAPGVVKADATQVRRRSVLPVSDEFLASVEVGILGKSGFREWLCAMLVNTPHVSLAFNHEGPVTADLIAELSATGVVLVDGESGREMALRAPSGMSEDAISRVNVILIADPANFKPPRQVAVVIGRHWSVLLATNAENPRRLGKAIRKAADGRSTIDPGIDPQMVRIANDLSARGNI